MKSVWTWRYLTITIVLYICLEDHVIGKPVDDWSSRDSNISFVDLGETRSFDSSRLFENIGVGEEGDATSMSGNETNKDEVYEPSDWRVDMFNTSEELVPHVESVTVPHMAESQIMSHNTESETVPHVAESETVPHVAESQIMSHNTESETVPHVAESETVPHVAESQIMSHNTESETVPHVAESETVPHMAESQIMSHNTESETVPHVAESETVPHVAESETVPHVAESETVPHVAESEAMSHVTESESMSHNAESETVPHGAESEAMSHNEESETLPHMAQSETMPQMAESEPMSHNAESERVPHMVESGVDQTEEPPHEAVYDDEEIFVEKKNGESTAENGERDADERFDSQPDGEVESPSAGLSHDNVTVQTGLVTGHFIPGSQPTDGLKLTASDVTMFIVNHTRTTPTYLSDLTTDAPNEVQFSGGQTNADPGVSVNVSGDTGRGPEDNSTQEDHVAPVDHDITATDYNGDSATNSSSDRADNTDSSFYSGGDRRHPGFEISGGDSRGNLSEVGSLTPGVGPQIQQTQEAPLVDQTTQPYLSTLAPTPIGSNVDGVKQDPTQVLLPTVSTDTGNPNTTHGSRETSGGHDATTESGPPSDGHRAVTDPPSDGHRAVTDPPSDGHMAVTDPPSDGHRAVTDPPSDGHRAVTDPPSDGHRAVTDPPSDGHRAVTDQEPLTEATSSQVMNAATVNSQATENWDFTDTTSTTPTTDFASKDLNTATPWTTTAGDTATTKSPSFVDETTPTLISDVSVAISDTTSMTHYTSTPRASTTPTSSSTEPGTSSPSAKSTKTTFLPAVDTHSPTTQLTAAIHSSLATSTESTVDYPVETLMPDLHLSVDGSHEKSSPTPTSTDKTLTSPRETRPLPSGQTSTVSGQSPSIIKIPDRQPTTDNVNCSFDRGFTGSHNDITLAEGGSVLPSVYMILEFEISWSTYCKSKDGIKTDIIKVMSNGTTPVNIDQIKVLDLDKCQCTDTSQEIHVNVFLLNKTKIYDHDLTQQCARALQNLIGSNCSFVILNKLRSVVVNGETQVGHVSVPAEDSHLLSDPGVTVAIVLAVVGGCCCIALISLQVIVRRRNKDGLSLKPNLKRSSSWSSDSIRLSSINKSRPNSGLFNPGLDITDLLEPSRTLNYTLLSNYCCNAKKIEEEFQTLPLRMPRLSVVPSGEEDKNRYANVLPLTHTRVKLFQDGPEQRGTYINANYVTGPNSQCQYYIATQAPTNTTMADFWTMIWQQNSKAIVMLTQLEEDGQSKCVLYWPELVGKSAAMKIGDFLIELKQKDVHQEYIISKLEVQHLRKIEKREVYHFWYTCWPSHGLPEPISLVKLVLDTRPKYEDGMAPLVVHCSPGTGRTGTFIALDLCMRQFETHRMVDVLKTVFLIRQERAGAIQSKEQYYLLYNAISEYATVVVSPVVSAASSATTLHALLSS